MSEMIFTREKLQEIHNRSIIENKNKIDKIRQHKIDSEVLSITMSIFNVNNQGKKTYTKYVYKDDETFTSDIVDILSKRFFGCIITTQNDIIWRLFNYCTITVEW